MVKVMKKELEDKFNVIWFNTSDIRQSCLCSLDALNQMCRTYSVSISYNGDFVFSKFPCLSNMDLIHLVSHAHEPFFRIFQNCIMCCFSDIRTIIFHEGLCIFENPYSGLLLDTLQNTLKDDTFKEQPLFYLSAVCVALIDMWKERIQAVLHEKSYNRMERQKNVFSVASEHGLSLSNAQQLQLELREFRQGMSFLLKDRVEDMVNIVRDTKSCSSLSLYLEEATCLYRQVASLCETLTDKEMDAQAQSRLFQTSLVAHNFFGNIILSSCLIGATAGNSFGSNLNIPPYNSTKGIDGYLWYIVIIGSFVIWFTFLSLFLSKNRSLLKYLWKLVKKRQNPKQCVKPT